MISIVSDLHLDFKNDRQRREIFSLFDKPHCDTMVLAGDVASVHIPSGLEAWDNLIEKLTDNYDHIVAVMGNHEHYFGDISDSAQIIRSRYPSVSLLDREIWIHPQKDFSIAGCTLWSHITDVETAGLVVNSLINCSYLDQFFTANSYNWLHQRDLNWIKQQKADVYLTHYPPTYRACRPRSRDNQYFCSSSQILRGKKCWIAGHTHLRKDFYQHGCRVVLNCLGHHNEYHSFQVKTIRL